MTRSKAQLRLVAGGATLGAIIVALLILLSPQELQIASVVEVFLMVLPATLFPILYSVFFHWWENALGRALWTKAIGLALLIDVSVLYQLFGHNYFLQYHVQFLIFSLILTGLSYQLVVICKIKYDVIKENRRSRQSRDPEEADR